MLARASQRFGGSAPTSQEDEGSECWLKRSVSAAHMYRVSSCVGSARPELVHALAAGASRVASCVSSARAPLSFFACQEGAWIKASGVVAARPLGRERRAHESHRERLLLASPAQGYRKSRRSRRGLAVGASVRWCMGHDQLAAGARTTFVSVATVSARVCVQSGRLMKTVASGIVSA